MCVYTVHSLCIVLWQLNWNQVIVCDVTPWLFYPSVCKCGFAYLHACGVSEWVSLCASGCVCECVHAVVRLCGCWCCVVVCYTCRPSVKTEGAHEKYMIIIPPQCTQKPNWREGPLPICVERGTDRSGIVGSLGLCFIFTLRCFSWLLFCYRAKNTVLISTQ